MIADSPRSATRYFALDEKDLFKFNDPGSLAERIDWWLDHPEERRKRSEAYKKMSGQFNFESCMDSMERMLCNTAAKRRAEYTEPAYAEAYLEDDDEEAAEVAVNV